jgi:hypothetical protein
VKKKLSSIRSLCLCLLLVAGSLAIYTSAPPQKAFAASPDSCSPSGTKYGTDTMSIYVPVNATYTIWTRMEAASSSANSVLLNVDNTNCYNVGGDSTIPTNGSTWHWVNDYDGNTSNIVNVNLSQGTHSFELTGTESGVSIDRIIAVPVNGSGNVSCTPTDTQDDTAGTNCAPIYNTSSGPPTVSVLSPTGGTLSGTTTITADAATADPSNTEEGIASVQFELDGSTTLPSSSGDLNPAVVPSSGSTYSYSWDTSAVSNGTHTISAIATDDSGSTTTSSPVTVTVGNSTGSPGGLTTPTNLHVTARAGRSLIFAWTASTDTASGGPAVAGYRIYLNGSTSPQTSVSGTTYTGTGLTPGTAYSYSVAAYDSATTNNVSTHSNTVNDTTCEAGDIQCSGGPVGLPDLLILSENYNNNSGTATWAKGDLTGDGKVGLPDLLILSESWNNRGP